jgi:hypothetical protein
MILGFAAVDSPIIEAAAQRACAPPSSGGVYGMQATVLERRQRRDGRSPIDWFCRRSALS